MKLGLALLAPLLLTLAGCQLFGQAAETPPNPDGSITMPLPGGGNVTVVPPPPGSEPTNIDLPGGGSVTVNPPTDPPSTAGGVAGNIVGGTLGTLTGNPLIGTLAAAGFNALLGLLGARAKA